MIIVALQQAATGQLQTERRQNLGGIFFPCILAAVNSITMYIIGLGR